MCVHCNHQQLEPLLPNLQQPRLKFLQHNFFYYNVHSTQYPIYKGQLCFLFVFVSMIGTQNLSYPTYDNHDSLSAEFAPPSGMPQPSGYQIPPQYMYSRGGKYQSTSTPLQLPQQGMTQCDHSLSCTAMLLVSKLIIFLA